MKIKDLHSLLVKAFEELRYQKKVKNQSDFAAKLGYNRSYVSDLLNQNKETKQDTISKLFSVFPEIEYLSTGRVRTEEESLIISNPPVTPV